MPSSDGEAEIGVGMLGHVWAWVSGWGQGWSGIQDAGPKCSLSVML